MNAYCLFCTTAKRDEVAQKLRRKYGWHILCPKLIQRKWVRGTALEMLREYLPGYLFIYTDAPIENPLALRREDFVIRCLGAPDCGYVLQGGDLAFAEMLYNNNGTIGILKAYQEGDRVKLVQGALGSIEGEIIRLDRRKGRAQIQYQFDGAVYKTWVGFDLIDDPVTIPRAQEEKQEEKKENDGQ